VTDSDDARIALTIGEAIAERSHALIALSHDIWHHLELAFEERHAPRERSRRRHP